MKIRTTAKATGAKYCADHNRRVALVKAGKACWIRRKYFKPSEACDRAGIP